MAVTDEIYEMAAGLAPEQTDEALLRSLCMAAEKHFLSQIKQGASEQAYRESLICAGAFLALSYLPQTAKGAQQVKAFTVGDVSVTAAEGESLTGGADTLREKAEALMAPFCASAGGFAFLGVRG